jgi:hypothetical protein
VFPSNYDDSVGSKVLGESVWNAVIEIPPPSRRNKRDYIDHLLGHSADRSILLCRMNWSFGERGLSLDGTGPLDNVVPARVQFLLFWRWLRLG